MFIDENIMTFTTVTRYRSHYSDCRWNAFLRLLDRNFAATARPILSSNTPRTSPTNCCVVNIDFNKEKQRSHDADDGTMVSTSWVRERRWGQSPWLRRHCQNNQICLFRESLSFDVSCILRRSAMYPWTHHSSVVISTLLHFEGHKRTRRTLE